ncbi:GNAT family N-acetyltransferase [Leptobacterium flavescens]|uniref:GNAT family N-acetyltransferase n=1 Tax=Leptobacterium flavescens TaxID=472055 RepID=A0A6P0ULU8_9FLAO|nr:GNAT family N-acetyltransferase [Leptobacterium flavescens]NER12033.1 GNAT family N-acetyltransferase [Leptobacterium flavescens]
MRFVNTRELNFPQKIAIRELWNKEYPVKLRLETFNDLENYLSELEDPHHILLIDADKELKGWYVDFSREDERWFAMILNSELQGKGLGSKLLKMAMDRETELNGWVIDHEKDLKQNGKPYRSPIAFYLKNGFEILPDNRLELDKISAVRIRFRKLEEQ